MAGFCDSPFLHMHTRSNHCFFIILKFITKYVFTVECPFYSFIIERFMPFIFAFGASLELPIYFIEELIIIWLLPLFTFCVQIIPIHWLYFVFLSPTLVRPLDPVNCCTLSDISHCWRDNSIFYHRIADCPFVESTQALTLIIIL